MAREFFKDLPNTTTPLTASRLNGLLNGDEALGSIVVDDVSGKNMLNESNISSSAKSVGITYDGNKVYSTRTSSDNRPWDYDSSNYFITLDAGTYTLSLNFIHKITNSSGGLFRFFKEDNTFIGNVNAYNVDNASKTFTLTSTTKLGLYFKLYDGQVNIQIEQGSTATNYAPYNQPVKQKSYGVKESCTFYADDFKCRNLLSSFMELGSLNNDTGIPAQTTDAIRTANFIEVEPNTTYTVSNDKQYHVYIYEYSFASSSGFIQYTGANTDAYKGKSTITTTSTTKYIKIRTVVSNVENDLTSKWQLEVGSEVTSYIEYKQPVKKTSVGVKEDATFYANDFKCRNLFDKNQTFVSGTISDSGAEATSPNSARTINYIPVKEGTYIASYTTSNNSYLNVVACYNSSKTFITRLTNVRDSAFTLPSGTAYVRLVFYNSNGITISDFPNNYVTLVQLEIGSIATSYTEYKPIGEEIYSTNEMVIGRWTNGKPLYRKVVTGAVGTVSSDGTIVNTSINVGISNVDTIFIKNAYVNNGNNRLFPIPYSNDNGYWIKVYPLSGANYPNLRIGCNASTFSTNPVTVIVEYTKTTD